MNELLFLFISNYQTHVHIITNLFKINETASFYVLIRFREIFIIQNFKSQENFRIDFQKKL